MGVGGCSMTVVARDVYWRERCGLCADRFSKIIRDLVRYVMGIFIGNKRYGNILHLYFATAKIFINFLNTEEKNSIFSYIKVL